MTSIEWTDETWNVCTDCSDQLTPVVFQEDRLRKPLSWKKARKIFTNRKGDLFHPAIATEDITKVIAIMSITPWHTYQLLTKYPARMAELLSSARFTQTVKSFLEVEGEALKNWPLPNLWVGVAIENQEECDRSLPVLKSVPAAMRFLFCEPLQEEVDIRPHLKDNKIHWVVTEGDEELWLESLVEQCDAYELPIFIKKLGRAEKKKNQSSNTEDLVEFFRRREFPSRLTA